MEMTVVMVVAAVLVANSLPALHNYFEKNHLKGAAEILYGRLLQAKSESIKRFVPTYVNVTATGNSNWSYGISDNSNCDSGVALGSINDCTLAIAGTDVLQTEVNSASNPQFADIKLTAYSDAAMSVQANPLEISFDPVRGNSSGGTFKLASSGGWIIHAKVSLLGQIDLCSPAGNGHVTGYSVC